MLESIFFRLLDLIQDFRRVRFRTHEAVFEGSNQLFVFLTITNLSRTREIEVTHVWIETSPPASALLPERPLPIRLKPDEIWETWIPLSMVSQNDIKSVLQLGRMRLSDGRIIKSRPDRNVPHKGYIPGSQATKK